RNTEGSAIRRTGYEGWLRNLAIGLGNINFRESDSRESDSRKSVNGAPVSSGLVVAALENRKGYSALVDHHIEWAISQHQRVTRSS
ncbi:MAG: hypothetical protein ACNYPE_06780, partial [Candidatus Azotimanducaceae bacterium WSBS_2022_MAG_OTU7]